MQIDDIQSDSNTVRRVVLKSSDRIPPGIDLLIFAAGQQLAAWKIGGIDLHLTEAWLQQTLRPVKERRARIAGDDVFLKTSPGSLQPEAVSLEAKVLSGFAGIRVELVIAVERIVRVDNPQSDVANVGTQLIAGLVVEGGSGDVVSHVRDKVDVGRVIDVAPTRIARDDGPANSSGRLRRIGAAAVEVHGVATSHVRSGTVTDLSRIEIVEAVVVDRSALVRSTKLIEPSEIHIDVQRVHEHDMPAPHQLRVFGREQDVSRIVGNVNAQIRGGRDMITLQRLTECHSRAINRGDRNGLVTGRIVRVRAGNDEFIADSPADGNFAERQCRAARSSRFGQSCPGRFLRTEHHGLAVEDGSAADLRRIPGAIDLAAISEDDPSGHVSRDWIRLGPDLQQTAGCSDDRVHFQLSFDVRRKPQRAVDADCVKRLRDDAVHGERHAGWNVNVSPFRRRNAVLPDGSVGPVAGRDQSVRGSFRSRQCHRRAVFSRERRIVHVGTARAGILIAAGAAVVIAAVVLATFVLATFVLATFVLADRCDRIGGKHCPNLQQLGGIADRFSAGLSATVRAAGFQVAQPVNSQHDQLQNARGWM